MKDSLLLLPAFVISILNLMFIYLQDFGLAFCPTYKYRIFLCYDCFSFGNEFWTQQRS